MFSAIMSMQKEKKYLIQGLVFAFLFFALYTIVDFLNIGYSEMILEFGLLLVIANIFLNLIMAGISALLWNVSSALVKLTGKEGKGTFMSGFAFIFGMLTWGCTPCVIAFFATIGITFAVVALPLAGLPYKFIALALLIVGFIWLRYEANHPRCKIKLDKDKEKVS